MANSECFVLPRPTTPLMRTLYGGSRDATSARQCAPRRAASAPPRAPPPGGPVAALAGDECPVFRHQQWIGEAERDDAVCDLADLLRGMGSGITPIDLDMTDRQRLHPHIRGSQLGSRSAAAGHTLPLRNPSFTPPVRLNCHAHP